MQHICNMHGMLFRILLPFLSLVSLIFRLSHSFSGFSYLCGNDIMLQCFSFPLLRLSGLFVVNAVLLSFLCLHKIKVEENKLLTFNGQKSLFLFLSLSSPSVSLCLCESVSTHFLGLLPLSVMDPLPFFLVHKNGFLVETDCLCAVLGVDLVVHYADR